MRVIAKKTLVNFYSKHSSAKGSLEAWYSEIIEQDWGMPSDIIKMYAM